MGAESGYIRNNTMGELRVSNSDGSVALTLLYDRGDVAITPLRSRLNARQRVSRRGKHVSSAYGARIYPQITWSGYVSELVGDSDTKPGSVLEFLTLLGAYDDVTPVNGTGRPASVNLRLLIKGSEYGLVDTTVTLTNIEVDAEFREAEDGNTLSFTADILGTIVMTNGTQSITFNEIT